MSLYINEPSKKLPVSRSVDTVVVGGGIAGIAAALAAARHGNSVLLIEKEYLLGGLATAGLVTIYLPLCDGMGRQVSFGIAEELLRLSVKHGIEDKSCPCWLEGGSEDEKRNVRFEVQYNPHVFAIEAERLLKSENVNLLYGTFVCGAVCDGGRITHIIIENKSGRSAVAVKNVIDTSGDADVCRICGEETAEFAQGNVPAAWYYEVIDGKYHLNMLGFCDIPDSEKTPEQLAAANNSLRFGGLDADELTRLTQHAHDALLAEFLGKGAVSQAHAIATVATVPQIRMTRRLCGVYTQDDCELHREFEDSVGLFSDWRKKGPVYELPFGTLHGKKIKNLTVAGRCISVTDAMWDITRVIPVCAVSGQAAGTAAALCDDFGSLDIKALQSALKIDGVVLHEKEL